MKLVQKLYKHIVLKRVLGKHRIAAGLYLIRNGRGEYDEVFINVSNPVFSHLGDQLFYQPLVHHLATHGVRVKIATSGALVDYFRIIYGADAVSDRVDLTKRVLVVMPFWAYDPARDFGNADVLLVDLADPGIGLYVSGWLVTNVSGILGIDPQDRFDPVAQLYPTIGVRDINPVLPTDGDVLVFNNYIHSGQFRVNFNHQNALSACVRKLKKDGLAVVHVGTDADRTNDPRTYDFVDLDLRGKISPLDMMAYFYKPNVKCSVTFDNFVMHACLLANKKSYVRFRGRFTRAAREHHYRNVNEAFRNVAGKGMIQYL